MRKIVYCLVALAVVGIGASTVQAVAIDLSSPQEGTVLHPGDTVSLTVTVTNNSSRRDLITVTGTAAVSGITVPGPLTYSIQLNLKAGEVYTQTFSGTIPADYQLGNPVSVTLTAVAVGKKSGTTASDSVSATVEPLAPAP
jgi:uncharacterized protein YfaS (alpha-2-macroglobulin family)